MSTEKPVSRMNPTVKALWVSALRSGEYKQTTGCLEDANGNCCLGVLCRVALASGVPLNYEPVGTIRDAEYDEDVFTLSESKFSGISEILPKEVQKWAELDNCDPSVDIDGTASLSDHNDGNGAYKKRMFSEIADAIEAQL